MNKKKTDRAWRARAFAHSVKRDVRKVMGGTLPLGYLETVEADLNVILKELDSLLKDRDACVAREMADWEKK